MNSNHLFFNFNYLRKKLGGGTKKVLLRSLDGIVKRAKRSTLGGH